MFLVWIKSFDYSKIEFLKVKVKLLPLIENAMAMKVKAFTNIVNCLLFGIVTYPSNLHTLIII